jgi:zinc/manganese transport system substrate-binding protein
MKPSFATLLNRADILLLMGLEVEHAFLPALLEAARNPKILRDAPGYIDCSVYVTPLEVPTRLDRALGDVHPMGNPHINLDPVAGKSMARAMGDGLTRNYPEHAATFKKNLTVYLGTLDAAIARWQREAAPLRGVKFISYHPDMIYFAERFGMEAAGRLRSAPVWTRRLAILSLWRSACAVRCGVVVRERHYPAGLETIAQRTGAKLVELPAMVGGVPEARDYVSFIDYNIRTMLKAVQGIMSGTLLTLRDVELRIRRPGRARASLVCCRIRRMPCPGGAKWCWQDDPLAWHTRTHSRARRSN